MSKLKKKLTRLLATMDLWLKSLSLGLDYALQPCPIEEERQAIEIYRQRKPRW
jgi:hypothetical protein